MKNLVPLCFVLLALIATGSAQAADQAPALPWLDQPSCAAASGVELSSATPAPSTSAQTNLNPLDSATDLHHGPFNPCACAHNRITCLTLCNGDPTCDAACDADFAECLCSCKGIC